MITIETEGNQNKERHINGIKKQGKKNGHKKKEGTQGENKRREGEKERIADMH